LELGEDLPRDPATTGRAIRDPATTGRAISEKLARTDGVLCPPETIDPEMKIPAPPGGTIQVIPAPGTPGGDPTLRPK
jgi:hypothetical protein